MTARAPSALRIRPLRTFAVALGLALMLAAAVPAARAELRIGHQMPRGEDPKATPIPFTASDYLRVALTPMDRTNFSLGEPVVVPLRLVNHTQFKVTAVTNVNPRGGLKVTVYSEDRTKRAYNGPYETGGYVAEDILLYPFEEVPLDAVLWGDLETPNGLVFPAPGAYLLKVELEVSARLSSVKGVIPVEPIMIKVGPPSERLAPLVGILSGAKAWPDLHRRRVPEFLRGDLPKLADEYGDTVIGAFMNYALGLELGAAAGGDAARTGGAAEALKRIDAASRVEGFPWRAEALRGLVYMHDRDSNAPAALATCERLIEILPPERAAIQASTPLISRYLGNSAEMDPVFYWDLLE